MKHRCRSSRAKGRTISRGKCRCFAEHHKSPPNFNTKLTVLRAKTALPFHKNTVSSAWAAGCDGGRKGLKKGQAAGGTGAGGGTDGTICRHPLRKLREAARGSVGGKKGKRRKEERNMQKTKEESAGNTGAQCQRYWAPVWATMGPIVAEDGPHLRRRWSPLCFRLRAAAAGGGPQPTVQRGKEERKRGATPAGTAGGRRRCRPPVYKVWRAGDA